MIICFFLVLNPSTPFLCNTIILLPLSAVGVLSDLKTTRFFSHMDFPLTNHSVFFNYLPLVFPHLQTQRAASTRGGSSMATATGTSVGDTPGRTPRRTAGSTVATWLVSTAWPSRTSSEVGGGWGGREDKDRLGTDSVAFVNVSD